ncbi:Lrp/AsnC family transcriptional regulator [Natronococcus wangiae]|uniref:Lrp/AsnC family transcriptional regulator n=1 Tax=Natronococcus wangiae TaxID=3068275 RepID=UPI00273E4ACA|nr:Lrp/AsnC family transcriptional regulator [Natronococcus sp. AD5]
MSDPRQSDLDFDEIDLAILERVETDFDVSLETLASELDVSKSAVHYRLNKFKENGVIEGITADVDPLALGLEMVAITDVSVTHETGYSEDVGEELIALKGVDQVYYTMGDVDFVVISRVQSRDQLNDLIDRIIAIESVNETSSKFVMQEFKNDRGISANLTDEAREIVLGNE